MGGGLAVGTYMFIKTTKSFSNVFVKKKRILNLLITESFPFLK